MSRAITAGVQYFCRAARLSATSGARGGADLFDFGLLDLRASWQLRTIDRFEFRLSVLTTVGVLTIGVLPGVVLAILLALFHVLARIYKPQDAILGRVPGLDGYNDIGLDPRSETVPGAILYRFEGPLLFFNAEYFKSRVRTLCSETTPRPHWFVLSVESVTQVDTRVNSNRGMSLNEDVEVWFKLPVWIDG